MTEHSKQLANVIFHLQKFGEASQPRVFSTLVLLHEMGRNPGYNFYFSPIDGPVSDAMEDDWDLLSNQFLDENFGGERFTLPPTMIDKSMDIVSDVAELIISTSITAVRFAVAYMLRRKYGADHAEALTGATKAPYLRSILNEGVAHEGLCLLQTLKMYNEKWEKRYLG